MGLYGIGELGGLVGLRVSLVETEIIGCPREHLHLGHVYRIAYL